MDKYEEIIIRVDQKLTDLTKSVKKDSDSNIKAHDEILQKIKEQRSCMITNSKNFITNKLFYWVLGFVILGIIGVASLTSNNYACIERIDTKLEFNLDE